ncbi:hypothetical protein ABEW34_21795 [Paenibacillus algorifonticola]|uniref:hypothetical protein n=1 Tax=Paenibacillus algorifonticola TaxID=684063 RepID=UPI003D2B9308
MNKSLAVKVCSCCLIILSILLSACSIKQENPQEQRPSAIPIAEPLLSSTISPTASTYHHSLSDYSGSWTDAVFNQYLCDNCFSGIDIYSTDSDTGSLSFYLYNPDRVMDSSTEIKLTDNEGSFLLEDDAGKGTGTIKLEPDRVIITLKMDTDIEGVLEAYSGERTFVRDPYIGLTYLDPLTLMTDYVKDKDGLNSLNYIYDDSAEWNEELNGTDELKVIVGLDDKGEITKRFTVNRLTGNIVELPFF